MRKLFLSAVLTLGTVAHVDAQTLTFEGIASGTAFTPVGNYYNGGSGPNVGVDFFGGASVFNSRANGCTGNGAFAGQPSGCAALVFTTPTSNTVFVGMNKASGFGTTFSFFYSAPFVTGQVRLFSGLNGTGTLLGSLSLATTEIGGTGCPANTYCPFVSASLAFTGIAKSALFTISQDNLLLDDVTFGSAEPDLPMSPVPEPESVWLFGAGLLAVYALDSVRRKKAQR